MRRKTRSQSDAPGQDSFLDIVANLVGILIILVMIVGARAKSAWVATVVGEKAAARIKLLLEDVEVSRGATENLAHDINRLDDKIKEVQAATALRDEERDKVQFVISAVQSEIDRQRDQLGAAQREQFDLLRQIEDAKNELRNLADKKNVIDNASAETSVITHLPTPMARTVFNKEVHFRLLGGRLAYVPMNELIEELKSEINFKAEKLRQNSQIVETVGPIAGFYLRYRLRLAESVNRTDYGIIKRTLPRFDGFYLTPVRDDLGEPFDDAMQTGSRFRRRLDRLKPKNTTITVWVYPDSYKEFRTLKRELFERGFLTASWPLPAGQPIAGGPDGKRSVAE